MAHLVAALLAAWFLIAGIGHFVRPAFYEAALPTWFPAPELANLGAAAAAVAAWLAWWERRAVSA